MNRVEHLATYLAESIQRNNPQSSSVPVLRFALISAINTMITILIVLMVTSITGHFLSGIMAVIAFPLLRYVSGGLHLKSPNLCNVVTASFMLLAIYIPADYWYTGIGLNVLAFTILLINAPSGMKRNTMSPQYYPLLKVIALVIVSSNFVIQSPVLSLVFFIQSLTTSSLSQKLIDRINSDIRG